MFHFVHLIMIELNGIELNGIALHCITLNLGFRPYREYPSSWVIHTLQKSNLTILETMEFPIQYTRSKILNQLQVAQKYLHYLSYEPLVYGLQRAIDDLKEEVNVLFDQHPNDGDDNDFYITSGFDYLVIAEKPLE